MQIAGIAVLGPLAVRDGTGAGVEIAGARLRCLLTRLALSPGRAVPVGALVDAVWADVPPADENNALQTLVSRLRRQLGSDAVLAEPGGYRLAVDPRDVDVHRFEQLVTRGTREVRDRDHAAAAQTLDEALRLWRGPALVDAASANDALAATVTRLEDLRLTARVARAEVEVVLGEPSAVATTETLAAEHPLHERIAALALRALALDGRQAEALAAYDRLRVRLADELGVDPSSELQALHLELLQGTATPARPLGVRRTNLRAQLTSFVGREQDVTRIGETLAEHRLVTLVGPGGAGKTRLCAEAAGRLVEVTPDGVWLVELAPVTSGTDVAQAVWDAVGLHESSVVDRHPKTPRDVQSRLVEALAERDLLLLVDNCEHLIESTAAVVDHLLARCPRLRVLATSREPLGIVGEVLLPVPPLGQPDPAAGVEESLGYPAVALFVDRASAVQSGFRLDDVSVAPVIEIVRKLDGLPLAIELAAARTRTLAIAEIARRLGDRFRLLTGGSRTALPRHRTLRAVVEWSWDLLTDDERSFAAQLAVFPAGVTAASAAAVAGVDVLDSADLLSSLADKSLLQRVGDSGRLRMLETIREFGVEWLAEQGTLAGVRLRHAEHFAALMAEAEPHLTRADQLEWFDLLRAEKENVISALRHLCDVGDVGAAVTLGLSLSMYSMMLGLWDEMSNWLGDVTALRDDAEPQSMLIIRALEALSWTATGDLLGDVDDQRDRLARLAHELADVPATVSPWIVLIRPIIAFFTQDAELIEDAFQRGSGSDDEWTRAALQMFHAALAENEGDTATARADTEQSLQVFARLGERWGMANALRSLAQMLTLEGNLDEAADAYERARQLSAELHSQEDEGFLHGRLADLELRRGNVDAARKHVELARLAAQDHGSSMEELFALSMLGSIELTVGNLDEARVLHKRALARLDELPREHPAHGHIRAMTLGAAVRFAVVDGAADAMWETAREAYTVAVATRDMPVVASVGVHLAELFAVTGDAARAALVLGASAMLRGSNDATSIEVGRVQARLVEALGEPRAVELVARGRALDRDGALAVLDPANADAPPAVPSGTADGA